jgi:methylmalonyl-CoA mutase N-terminal domain/subunit
MTINAPAAIMLAFYVVAAERRGTAPDHRTAIEALAGVLGGTQSLHTNSFDEALALPAEGAVRVALRTQQIIAEETGVTNTIDPLGRSYFVEALTDRMEELCYQYFNKIDQIGGMVEAVKQGFPQREIAGAAFRYQEEVESGVRKVVGLNSYTEGEDDPTRDPPDRSRVRERSDPACQGRPGAPGRRPRQGLAGGARAGRS